MKIILDTSECGLTLTAYGYDELLRRKADKGLSDVWDKKFIDKNIDEVWFRCDEDLIDIAEKFTAGMIYHDFKIVEFELPQGIDILSDKLKIDESEFNDYQEALIIQLA